MKKIIYLHPINGTNLGDNLTFLGTKYLMEKHFGPHEIIVADLGSLELDPKKFDLEYKDVEADILCISGTPWIWDECIYSTKYKLLKLFMEKFKDKPKFALGIGSCFPITTNTLGIFILDENKEHSSRKLKEIWLQFDKIVTRDQIATQILKEIGVPAMDGYCTSLHSFGNIKSTPLIKKETPLLVYYNPALGVSKISCDYYFVKDYIDFQLRFVKEYNPKVITICPGDRDDAISRGVKATWITEVDVLLNILGEHKFVVAGRVHSAIPAYFLGVPSFLLPVDTRYLTAVRVGVIPIFTTGLPKIDFTKLLYIPDNYKIIQNKIEKEILNYLKE